MRNSENHRATLRMLIAVSMLAAVILMGCRRGSDQTGSSAGSATEQKAEVAAQSAADRWPSPSEAACQDFALAFEQAAQEANVASMNALIDWDVIVEKVVGDSEGDAKFLAAFKKGAKIGAQGSTGLAGELAANVSQGATCKVLRVRTRDGRPAVLVRLISVDTGVNYFEFLVATNPQGLVRAIDVYNYLTAEYLSTTMRHMFLPLAANESRGLLAKLTGQENELVKHFSKFREMKDDIGAGRFAEAVQIYHALPESLQKEKLFLLMRVQAAMRMGEQEYGEALDDFFRYHAEDPCIDVLSIDYFTLMNQPEKVIASIERVEKAVDGDPYLLVLKGNVYVSSGDVSKGREMFQAALDAEPTLEDVYYGFVGASLAEKNFAETVRWLNELKSRFQFDADLTTVSDYSEFVKSPEYQAWIAEQVQEPDK